MPKDENNTGGDPQDSNNNAEKITFESFEAFLEKQPKEIKDLYDGHTAGLKNALNDERNSVKDLKTQLKDLAGKAEKGSELETTLNQKLAYIETLEKKTLFLDQAIKPEIGCRNPKAAFLVAQAEDLFKKDGSPDWELIKKAAPELFGTKIPDGKAGDGTDGNETVTDMNTIIRQATGFAQKTG